MCVSMSVVLHAPPTGTHVNSIQHRVVQHGQCHTEKQPPARQHPQVHTTSAMSNQNPHVLHSVDCNVDCNVDYMREITSSTSDSVYK